MKLLDAIWIWLIAAALAFFAVPIVPMAMRWPVRVLVPVALALCLFALIRKTFSLQKQQRPRFFFPRFLAIVVICFGALAIQPYAILKGLQLIGKRPIGKLKPFVSHATALKQALDEDGICLTVMAMPYSGSFVTGGEEHDPLPASLEAQLARETLKQLENSGVPSIDLFGIFEKHASTRKAWKSDLFHLQPETVAAITPEIIEALRSDGVAPDASESQTNLVLMGECFANRFGIRIQETEPGWKELEILFAQGGAERVPNSLFLFQDEYLRDTSQIIWLVPYQLLASNSMPPLTTEPEIGSTEARSARLKVISCLNWGYERSEYEDRLKGLPYPDALVEIVCEIVDGEDFEKGERIVLFGLGIQDRQPLPLSHLSNGQSIATNLIPFASHVAENPKVGRIYIINNEAPFELERYWIHSWTHLR